MKLLLFSLGFLVFTDAVRIDIFGRSGQGYEHEKDSTNHQFLCPVLKQAKPFNAKQPGNQIIHLYHNLTSYLIDQSTNKGGNFLVSPLSLYSILALLYTGSNGKTRTELEKILRFRNDSKGSKYLRTLRMALNIFSDNKKRQVKINIANQIIFNEGVEITSFYRKVGKCYLKSMPKRIDFQRYPEPSRNIINKWVEHRTKTEEILPQESVDSGTKLVMLSAFSMSAPFRYPFTRDTKTHNFFPLRYVGDVALTGVPTQVPMMMVTAVLSVEVTPYVLMIDLPLKSRRGNFAFRLYVERTRLRRNLTKEENEGSKRMLIELHMPEFHVAFKSDLTKILTDSMNATSLKTGMGVHSTMIRTKEVLHLDKFIHEAHITVGPYGINRKAEEKGHSHISVFTQEPWVIKVNRPFMFHIVHVPTNIILLGGKIGAPEIKPKEKKNLPFWKRWFKIKS